MAHENEPSKPIQPSALPEAAQLPAAPLSGAPVPGAQLPAPSTAPDALYPSGRITSGSQQNRQQRAGSVLIVVVLMVATAALILVFIGMSRFAGEDTSSDLTGQIVPAIPITEPIPGTVPGVEEPEPPLPIVDATNDGTVGFDTRVPVTFRVTGDANGSVWNVVVSEPYDVTELVVASSDYNEAPPEGVRFVGFDLEMTLASSPIEPLSTGAIVEWEILAGLATQAYSPGSIAEAPSCGTVPNEFNNFAPAFVGGTLSGLVCIPTMLSEDISETVVGIVLQVGDERVVFSRNGRTPDAAQITESLGITSATERGYDAPVPLELNGVFTEAAGSTWNVSVGEPTDITDQVLAYNAYNDDPPPEFAYAGFDVGLTLASADAVPINTLFAIEWEVIGGKTLRVYDIGTVEGVYGCGSIEDGLDSATDLFVGGTVSGQMCIPVPTQDLGHPDTRVAISVAGERTVFGPIGPIPAPAALVPQGGPSALDGQHSYREPVAVQLDSEDSSGPVWIATVSQWNDITDSLVVDSLFNEPPAPGFAFVGFDLELLLESAKTSPQAPGTLLRGEVLGGETLQVHRSSSVGNLLGCGVIADRFDSDVEVQIGGSITGTVCIPVPIADLENADTRFALNTPGGRVVFGAANAEDPAG